MTHQVLRVQGWGIWDKGRRERGGLPIGLEFLWVFTGVAQGGTINVVVEGVSLQLVTMASESSAQVAANLAALINGNATLVALGVAAEFLGTTIATDGDVSFTEVNDPGLGVGAQVPGFQMLGYGMLGMMLVLIGTQRLGVLRRGIERL